MAARHSIPPFPDNLDRDYFGAWLSGFVDGEGCFHINWVNKRPYTAFTICVRQDDAQILGLIRSFLQCGSPIAMIKTYPRKNRPDSENEAPTARLLVKGVRDCYVVSQHFDRYPLLAKKARDFTIWREAVWFLYERVTRITYDSRNRTRQGSPRWKDGARSKWDAFVKAIREQRKFINAGTIIELPQTLLPAPSPPLFD